jgi:FkbM family methyltransferase
LACVFLASIILILSITTLIDYFSKPNYPKTQQIYSVQQSAYLSSDDEIVLHVHNDTKHYIYIDIGCFNGETIEHFIHFNPDSINYDIITFEPDPRNYQLCKRRLTQNKYRNYNIIIIPKIVWIRDEKLSYKIDLGQRSRIDLTKTSLTKLEAIDFSTWLKRLIPSKNTKLHIKISMPGTENQLLEKMIVDDTLVLAHQWDVEWTTNPNRRSLPVRYYLQSMFNSLGYDWMYLTTLRDRRQVFQMERTFENITKYRSLKDIGHLDLFYHYVQRPDLTTKKFKEF